MIFCLLNLLRISVLLKKMANKLTTQGILDLLENGEVSDLEITDDDEDDLAFDGRDDFPGVELDDLL